MALQKTHVFRTGTAQFTVSRTARRASVPLAAWLAAQAAEKIVAEKPRLADLFGKEVPDRSAGCDWIAFTSTLSAFLVFAFGDILSQD